MDGNPNRPPQRKVTESNCSPTADDLRDGDEACVDSCTLPDMLNSNRIPYFAIPNTRWYELVENVNKDLRWYGSKVAASAMVAPVLSFPVLTAP